MKPMKEDPVNSLVKWELLDPFKFFLDIDKIVKMYPSYNHDQVFYLELDFVANLLIMNKTQGELQDAYQEAYRLMNKKTN